MQQAVAQILGETLNTINRRLDHQRSLNHVLYEPPLVGEIENCACRISSGLSYVMQYGSGQEKVAIDLGVLVGDVEAQLDDGQSVFKQPADAGVVVQLGGRCLAEGCIELCVWEHVVEEG